MATLTVIGIGNRLRGDDALGPLAIDALRSINEEGLELVDAGSDAIGMLEYLSDRGKVLIIDACKMGREPGSLVCFSPEQAELVLEPDPLSLHGLGLAEALRMAGSLQLLPDDLKIIGIEPDSIQFNGQLSKTAQQALEMIVQEVHRELHETKRNPAILL